MREFEWWAIDKDGHKHHNYIKTKSSRANKVKAIIRDKHGVDASTCRDFGIRDVTDQ